MKQGHLAEYFSGVGVKTLSGTELDPLVSNGHEIQGTKPLQAFLGLPTSPQRLPCTYMWLTDDDAPLRHDGTATWYDSRANQPHRAPEPRLLYTSAAESVVRSARPGDSLFVCLRGARQLVLLLCPSGSDIEQQLLWLFGLGDPTRKLEPRDLRHSDGRALDFAARQILEAIEVEVPISDDYWLDRLLKTFGPAFPATSAFSEFARQNAEFVCPISDPDGALMSWLELEDVMFHTLERHLIEERLRAGFSEGDRLDVDGFVTFSLSVHGRRKSRAGHSLEHHLANLLTTHGVTFERGARTEGNKKPDFLFPGSAAYRDPAFPSDALTLLGVKTTCKDRWRQVLSEGERVRRKHLLTLEAGISLNQTNEMNAAHLQLVVPSSIQGSYREPQQNWLMSVAELIQFVKAKASSTPHAP